MKNLFLVIAMDIQESIRSRWFHLYLLIFGGLIFLLFWLGITESEVMGFTGVNRLLLTYIQLTIAVLPLFIIIATVRTIVGDRETNVLEYYLSLPFTLGSFYWGKFAGRFLSIVVPVFVVMTGAVIWGLYNELEIRWDIYLLYSLIVISLSVCFLGFAMLLSSMVKRHDTGLAIALLIWLILLIFIDVVLIGVFIQYEVPINVILGIALINPLQVFRIAALVLFDPRLSVIGATAYTILDIFGKAGYLLYAITYPMILGFITAFIGFFLFKQRDMV